MWHMSNVHIDYNSYIFEKDISGRQEQQKCASVYFY